MKLTPLEFKFEQFQQKMQELKEKEHYDYLVIKTTFDIQ